MEIYSTILYKLYSFLISIILNSRGAVYIVNNKSLFILDTFKLIIELKIVNIRIESLTIRGIEDYLIKNFFNSNYRLKTKNLLLKNVKLVNYFYINIILEEYLNVARV